jgi:hypothetical protein
MGEFCNFPNLVKMLRDVIPEKAGFIFILDSQSNIIREETSPNEGFFNTSYRGKELFISYYISPYITFKFVAVAPLDQI